MASLWRTLLQAARLSYLQRGVSIFHPNCLQQFSKPQCCQAYGARSYKLLGTYLQRAQLICWSLCIPIAALWLNVSLH